MVKNAPKATTIIARSKNFIQTDLWRIRLKDLDRKKGFLVKSLRIIFIAAKKFISDKCALRASALTLYSLLSIVPVMAMAFAVAKGFELQNLLEQELREQFSGQQEVINQVIAYARTMLEQTRGGLLAGIGAVTLLWAVIKALTNIEQSFNDIWSNTTPRSLAKKFSNYLPIVMVAPILLIVSGSATVMIVSKMTTITEKIAFLGIFSPIIMLLLKLIPSGVIWILFTFVYVFMPNTKVSIKSGLVGGVIAGTAFKLLQWAYLYFQVGVSQYNAIYGSFAALPLFLIWLQMSWLVVLFGAELSFAHQKADEYELEPDSRNISASLRKMLSLSVVHLLVKNFQRGERPLTGDQIAGTLDIPIRLIKEILDALSSSGLINRTMNEKETAAGWQPARDINSITIAAVIEALDKNGTSELPVAPTRELRLLTESVNACYDAIRTSPANSMLKDI